MKWSNVIKAHTLENVIAQVVAAVVICTVYGVVYEIWDERQTKKRLMEYKASGKTQEV